MRKACRLPALRLDSTVIVLLNKTLFAKKRVCANLSPPKPFLNACLVIVKSGISRTIYLRIQGNNKWLTRHKRVSKNNTTKGLLIVYSEYK